MIAVSTNLKGVTEFGIDPANVFGFWDWVGGRFSVCSPVGVVPLALHYGFDIVRDLLDGAHDVDVHFQTAEFRHNIPVLLGLIGVWNSTFMGSLRKRCCLWASTPNTSKATDSNAMSDVTPTSATAAATPPASTAFSSSEHPDFIQSLLALHDKYVYLVTNCFGKHAVFNRSMKEAFERFVNEQVRGTSTAQLFVNYCG